MKNPLFALALVSLGTAAVPAATSWNVPGAWVTDAWNPASNPMTETSIGSGVWTATITGQAASSYYEFKVAGDGAWMETYPPANSWGYTDAGGNITITFDTNSLTGGWAAAQNRIIVSGDSAIANIHATGDFMGEAGGAGDWNPGDPAFIMTNGGGGIYSLLSTISTPGSYQWKATKGDWAGQWGADGRSVNSATQFFTTAAPNDQVLFEFDSNTGAIRTTVIPETSAALLGALALLGLLRRRR